jgi:hypothetical protein
MTIRFAPNGFAVRVPDARDEALRVFLVAEAERQHPKARPSLTAAV